MPKLLVCVHESDDIRGALVNKVFENMDQVVEEYGLSHRNFEGPNEGLGAKYVFRKGKHSINVHEADFSGKLSHR